MPAGEGLAWAGHDRNAHPEGLAGRHAPRVRERIEGQVDRVVAGQQVGPGLGAAELELLRDRRRPPRTPAPIRSRAVVPSRAGVTSNNRDPGTRRTISAQSLMHLGRDLGHVVEAAKRDGAPLEGRQWADRGCLRRRLEADVAIRHPQHPFAVVRHGVRVGRGIGRRSGNPSPSGRSSRRSRSN